MGGGCLDLGFLEGNLKMLFFFSCFPKVEQTECLHCLKRKWVHQANEYQLSNGLSGGMCALVENKGVCVQDPAHPAPPYGHQRRWCGKWGISIC